MTKKQAVDVFLHMDNTKYHVGRCLQIEHRIYFEYQPDFISTGIELSPFKLPLKAGTYNDTERTFNGLPGLLYDSLPDGWGLLLMDRYFLKEGIEPSTVSPLERLSFIGDRALGSLSYQPILDVEFGGKNQINLETLAMHCEQILHGKEDHILSELIVAGGSPGGAIPKVILGYNEKEDALLTGVAELPKDYQHYLIKFPSMIDPIDNAEVEFAYSLMATACGIHMPKTRLFNAGKYGAAFGIERFDRKGNQRIHMHSLSGLLHANFRIPNLDYIDFLKAIWLLTEDQQQVLEGYRRMVFNVLTHNRDDHSKNFSFLYDSHQWKLSPAYDLTFSAGIANQHTMTIAGEGANPRKTHFLKVAEKLNINLAMANNIISEVKEVTEKWQDYAVIANVPNNIKARLKRIIDNISI